MKKNRVLFVLVAGLACGVQVVSADWNDAQWIGFTNEVRDQQYAVRPSQLEKEPAPKMKKTFPAPLLRKEFTVNAPVKSATVQVCGLGLYELYLNGKKVGDRVLDPAQTTYDKRAFFVIHDVTGLLCRGGNAIGLMLGNGFYGQNFAFGGGLGYGAPRIKMVLTVEYTDGSKETVVTDETARDAVVICRTIRTLGSRLNRERVCRTRAEWRGESQDGANMVNESSRAALRTCIPTAGGGCGQ